MYKDFLEFKQEMNQVLTKYGPDSGNIDGIFKYPSRRVDEYFGDMSETSWNDTNLDWNLRG